MTLEVLVCKACGATWHSAPGKDLSLTLGCLVCGSPLDVSELELVDDAGEFDAGTADAPDG